jgi:type II secretory pathway component PulM
MICQGYNFPSSATGGVVLLDENVFMTGKHAVIYPVFIHICLRLGKALFGSYNIGIFAVAFIQLLSILAAVSCTLRYMIKKKIHFGIVLFVMIYYIAAPRIQNYMFLITKDVFSGCFLLLFLVTAYRMLKEPEERTRKRFVLLWLFACGAGMLRNDGKIVIGLSLLVMIFLMGRQLRKQLILVTAAFFLVVIGFNNVLMPALKITPVSSRVLYSIPFQQTARYVKEYGDEVTEEEKEAIDAVLAYDELAKKYKPQRSDRVKDTYKPESTKEDLKRYFKVWFQMFLKHPGVYFEATMNNYFYYVYPGERPASMYDYEYSTYCMEERVNQDKYLATIDMEITYPKALDKARTRFEKLRENLFALPVLSIFLCPAMLVWVFVLLVCYLLTKKRWNLLALQSPLFFSVLVCFASPCNGYYFRYLYGVALCLPVVVILSLKGAKDTETA